MQFCSALLWLSLWETDIYALKLHIAFWFDNLKQVLYTQLKADL